MKKVLSFIGTRPEAIKLAPVAHAFLAAGMESVKHRLCNTGQHRHLVGPLMEWFGIKPDFMLDLMTPNQDLAEFTSRALTEIDRLLNQEQPDLVICQGDTTTAMVVGLAGFYRRIPVAHVEAGLRTFNRFAPFPEEVNRCIIDLVADLCFAPTPKAAEVLRQSTVQAGQVVVTGNTAIDALQWTLKKLEEIDPMTLEAPTEVRPLLRGSHRKDLVLVTAHRRESFGTGMGQIATAVLRLAREFPALTWLFPLHPNPNAREVMTAVLSQTKNVMLLPPLNYPVICRLLSRCTVVLTDSGGLQEECPSLGVPVFVLRKISERTEAVDAGSARLVGTCADTIVPEVRKFLEDGAVQHHMRTPRPIYGDGRAAVRIVRSCAEFLGAHSDFAAPAD